MSLWTFAQIGDPSRIASEGDGSGAAMRTAPVGVLYPSSRLDELTRAAYECAIPAHGGQMAVCAAAAVAGAVSAALEGRSSAEVLTVALRASKDDESLRPCREASTIAGAVQEIYSDLAGRQHLIVEELAHRYFPDKPQTIVPLAISLALFTQSATANHLVGGEHRRRLRHGSLQLAAPLPEPSTLKR